MIRTAFFVDLIRNVKFIEIQSDTFHSSRNERNAVFIVTAIVGHEMKLLPFIDQKSRILCISAKSVE